MNNRQHRRLAFALALLFFFPPASAWTGLDEVEGCVRGNLPQDSSVQSIELRSIDRIGSEQVLKANVYWKRLDDDKSGLLAQFTKPSDISGSRLLVVQMELENEMYLYMPLLGKVRKITSKRIASSMYGSDFSYEDFERLYGMLDEMEVERQPDTRLEGRPVYVIVSRPYEASGSGYEKIVSYVDKETCVALKTELFDPKGRIRKVLTADSSAVTREGTIWVPRKLHMVDARDYTETWLTIESIEVEKEISDRLFDKDQLKQHENL